MSVLNAKFEVKFGLSALWHTPKLQSAISRDATRLWKRTFTEDCRKADIDMIYR